ncbi:hypothetical protein Droror1_Dr00026456 [Drosera rotundifolia]
MGIQERFSRGYLHNELFQTCKTRRTKNTTVGPRLATSGRYRACRAFGPPHSQSQANVGPLSGQLLGGRACCPGLVTTSGRAVSIGLGSSQYLGAVCKRRRAAPRLSLMDRCRVWWSPLRLPLVVSSLLPEVPAKRLAVRGRSWWPDLLPNEVDRGSGARWLLGVVLGSSSFPWPGKTGEVAGDDQRRPALVVWLGGWRCW